MADQSLSGLTEQQAKQFHEQFKVTFSAFVGIAAWCTCTSSPSILGFNPI